MNWIHGTVIHLTVLLLIVAIVPKQAHCAQQAVPPGLDPGILLEQERRRAPAQPFPAEPPIISPEPIKPKKEEPPPLRIRVKEFRLDGRITCFSRDELLGLLKDLLGKEATLEELQQAVERITALYRSRGYFLARAILPKQDITEGVITIIILEGLLEDSPADGGVTIKGTKLRLSEERIRRIIRSALTPGEALNLADLERGMLILNDLPGITSSANLEPGTAPGTTRLVIDVNEASLLHPYVMFDNYSNRYIGSYRAAVGVNLDDPTGGGDQLSLSASKTLQGDYYYFSVGYSRPVGYSGLVLGISYSQLAYQLGEELENLENKSDAKSITLTARYPVLRGRLSSLFFNAQYDWKALGNTALGTDISDKRINVVGLGLSWQAADSIWGGGFTQAGLTASAGDLELGRVQINLEADQASARANGSYAKLNFNAARTQRVANTLTFLLNASGQAAFKNLDSSEKMTLGGPTAVRAYPVNEASGDAGIRGSAELIWKAVPGTFLGDLQFSAFYDIGHIRQYHDLWQNAALTTPNSYSLQGAGVGMSLGKSGRYDMRIQYAWKIGSNPGRNAQGNDSDGRSDSGRAWFSASALF